MWQESKIADSSLPHDTNCVYDSYLCLSSRLITRLILSSTWPGATHWYFSSIKLSQHQVSFDDTEPKATNCAISQPRTAVGRLWLQWWRWNAHPLCQLPTEGFRVGITFCFPVDVLLIAKKPHAAFESPRRRSVTGSAAAAERSNRGPAAVAVFFCFFLSELDCIFMLKEQNNDTEGFLSFGKQQHRTSCHETVMCR